MVVGDETPFVVEPIATPPHLRLHVGGLGELRADARDVGDRPQRLAAQVQVVAEQLAHLRLHRRRQHVDAQVGGADHVHLVADLGAAGEEALARRR